ncbi:MAG: peroxidase family protein [Geminicoccaceae bacterium]
MSAPEARNSDGSNNNRDDPTLGTPGQRLKRLAGSDYEDGFSAIAGGRNARDISNQVFAQEGSTENQAGVSDLWTIWGQFIDHDLDLTPDASGEFVPIEGLTVPLQRSVFDPETGDDEPREQITVVTSFMDASMVYGSDAERMEALRCGEGGRLLTSEGNLLPVNASGLDNAGDRDPDNPLFVAGDVRANENTPLTTLHTLFVREHNYWADKIADENPQYTDEEVFQRARAIVEAEIQHVTYKEYLPILLGPDGLAPYQGYNPTVDPSISTEFSTAAFRFGHTMVSSIIQRLAENGDTIENGNLTVAEAFFNNDALKEDGPDVVLRGLAEGKAQELDTFVIDDLRNLLVSGAGDVGLDLTALNIERGRDHGIPKFLALRDAIEQTLGIDLPDINDFEDISSNPIIVERLRAAYGDVNEIDAWVGGLAEDAVDGALVGPTFFHILADQFTRTRDGDRFWYEERFKDNPELLAQIQNTSLSDIIKRTGEV